MEQDAEQMAPSPDAPPLVSEHLLAREIGLPRDTLAGLRRTHLKKEADWLIIEKKVWLTPEAASRLRELVGATTAPEEKNGQDDAPGEEPGAICLIVKSIPRNQRILVAQKKVGGEEVRVRVKNNVNFLPGMEIRAEQDREFADVFVLVGRCPRQRGRW